MLLPIALAVSTFVLYDNGKLTTDNDAGARQRLAPCSTFKIPNSLIALESKVVPDQHFPIAYDPKRDGEQAGAWSRDHDLASAIANSTVWYYKELARRIGPERMQRYVNQFQYGNRDISSGIDNFWLGGSLRISAEEQVDFLRRLHEGRLGVSSRSQSIVRDILLLETAPEYRWYGKTGMCADREHGPVVWHVGFVERDGRTAYYALNSMGGEFNELRDLRNKLVREKLAAAGLIDAAPPTNEVQLKARIDGLIAAFPGTVSLYAKNLDTGQIFAHSPDNRVRTASTIKLPIMVAIFNAIEQGKARWEDTITMTADDKVAGSGVIRELADGTKFTIRDLVHMMIVVSDNTATNLLLDRFTADAVNSELDKLGLKQTRSLRKILGDGRNLKPVASGHSREGLDPEYRRFGIGVSTPREMVELLERVERNPEMVAILRRQQYKEGIGRQLSDEDVASKSGALDRLRSDVGIVHSRGGRIALAITVDDMLRTDYSPDNAGNLLISDLAQALVTGLSVPVSELPPPEKKIELLTAIDHVQGLEVGGDRAWVSWVDRKNKTGHLAEFDLGSGRLLRKVDVHNGERYHPGGIAADKDSLWIPVAEYKPRSTAIIQRRSKKTLELLQQFEVKDHIGCIAARGNTLTAGNWDSRQIYTWDHSGKQLDVRDNTARTRYQDMKLSGSALVASGLLGTEGAIDFLHPDTLTLQRRIRVGKGDRGVILTNEGMAIHGGKLYLVPEDGPSRIYVFPLP